MIGGKQMGENAKDRIREIRETSGLSQEEFGKRYEIPIETLERWETGEEECQGYVVELLQKDVSREFVRAKWIKHHYDDDRICMKEMIECTHCGKCMCDRYNPYKNFCSYCGKKMDVE